MRIISQINELREHLTSVSQTKEIGFVPTMGALHQGHISLIDQSNRENDFTVCSIFVNPAQFNNATDFKKYPRHYEEDIAQLKAVGVDCLFMPDADEMYPQEMLYSFELGYLDKIMEGEFRSGHFGGVVTIITKLFNIVRPTRAYFGQKDLQQLVVIQLLATQFHFDVEVISCPIIREETGLAMSSRNERLDQDDRLLASKLYKTLQLTAEAYQKHHKIEEAQKEGQIYLSKFSSIKLEYLEIVDANSLHQISEQTKEIAVCIAASIKSVRLIDNLVLTV